MVRKLNTELTQQNNCGFLYLQLFSPDIYKFPYRKTSCE